MDILKRLKEYKNKFGWTDYKIAKEAGLSPNTVSNIFVRNTTPSLPTLQAICDAFGVTLSQFFAEGGMVALSAEQQSLLDKWMMLNVAQKKMLTQLIETYLGE